MALAGRKRTHNDEEGTQLGELLDDMKQKKDGTVQGDTVVIDGKDHDTVDGNSQAVAVAVWKVEEWHALLASCQ